MSFFSYRRNHSNEDVSSNTNSKNTNPSSSSTTTPISTTTTTSTISSSKHKQKQKQPTFIEKQFLNYGLRSIHVPAGLLLFNGMLWVEWLSILVLSVRFVIYSAKINEILVCLFVWLKPLFSTLFLCSWQWGEWCTCVLTGWKYQLNLYLLSLFYTLWIYGLLTYLHTYTLNLLDMLHCVD